LFWRDRETQRKSRDEQNNFDEICLDVEQVGTLVEHGDQTTVCKARSFNTGSFVMADLRRRQFLQNLALGLTTASLAVCQRSAAAEHRKRSFTVDLTCGAIGVRADGREAIELAHQYGFESVAPSPAFLAKLSADELQKLLADMKAKRLTWGAAGLPVNFRSDESAFLSGMKRLAEFAAPLQRAGANRVGTWLSPAHPSLTYRANFRLHVRRLREVAGILADHGQRLGIEYVGPKTSWSAGRHPFIHTMAEVKELLAEINQPNVGLLLDSWHWYTAHDTKADLLALSGREVIACHLNDAPVGVPVDEQVDGKRELPCATGIIDLKTFLGALVQIGYDGPICAEPFSKKLSAMPKDQALQSVAAAMRTAVALVE
jgi:sugar phosphate isomerase/epimerase